MGVVRMYRCGWWVLLLGGIIIDILIIIIFPTPLLSALFLTAASLFLCSFLKCFFSFFLL